MPNTQDLAGWVETCDMFHPYFKEKHKRHKNKNKTLTLIQLMMFLCYNVPQKVHVMGL